jgi:hypothetical protein
MIAVMKKVVGKHWLVGAVLTVSGIGFQPQQAAADPPFYSLPDGNSHGFCLDDSVLAGVEANIRATNARTEQDVPGYNAIEDERPCDLTGEYQVDARWFQGYAGGYRGTAVCAKPSNTPGICDRYHMVIDTNVIEDNGGPFLTNRFKTVCHENGHSMGLEHYNNGVYTIEDADPQYAQDPQNHDPHHDCQISGRVEADQDRWRYHNHHHQVHIDASFP